MRHKLCFIAKQIIRLIALLLCVSIIAFALMSISPINPLQSNVGEVALASMSSEQIAKLEAYWGMDTPAVERYVNWLSDFVRGDMGTSLLYRQDVSEVILEKIENSLSLLAFAWVFSGILGFVLGVISGSKKNSLTDKIICKISFIMASTPAFWIALLMLMIFSVWLGIFPSGLSVPIGMSSDDVTIWNRLYHAFLPAFCLSLTGIPNIAIHTREKMCEIMESDYILFAKSRGESQKWIVTKHCLRNMILPIITLQFASIGEIFGGSILIEEVFSYPGLGQATVDAGLGGDLPLLMAITLISTSLVFAGNLTANILYGCIDPRLRKYSKRGLQHDKIK